MVSDLLFNCTGSVVVEMYATLMGFLHESLIQLQHRYYKSGRWRFNVGKKVTLKLWKLFIKYGSDVSQFYKI